MGAKTISIPIDHRIEAMTGCCIGHTWIAAEGLGLPKSCRQDEAMALTGFQSASVRIQAGMPAVGTRALDTMARGKRMTSPIPWADSGLLLMMPRQAHPHDRA